jgi:hypothetical protein
MVKVINGMVSLLDCTSLLSIATRWNDQSDKWDWSSAKKKNLVITIKKKSKLV